MTPPLLQRAIAVLRRRGGAGSNHGSAATATDSNASAAAFPEERLWELEQSYRGNFPLPLLSYGTVRDFADSRDHLPDLAALSFDMKGLQRCWMVKAILGNAEPGGRLVEIGAGEPLVAGLLSRLGFDVTVVDPYDGSGNGPREYQTFKANYPDVEIIRDQFPPAQELHGQVAAVYSISVLEHIPAETVADVMQAAERLVAPAGGRSIHAIDHVLAGWGAEEHLQRLERIIEGSSVERGALNALIEKLEQDPETYYVSAEAHERWRGAAAYDDYPMRRIASLQLYREP
jgi:uncharacterized UPF0146 family protein